MGPFAEVWDHSEHSGKRKSLAPGVREGHSVLLRLGQARYLAAISSDFCQVSWEGKELRKKRLKSG